ncbi:uncharacterized protein SPAPADRAFT_57912 [Spathaspora passalidarum NRRL Y-27907]|uniref:SRP9 domain-containing protein n=1 Tax=Spathaspora passalidarum (strain NRRL Y-27907 / 11-Y1) TaxID=619300 RepID=G3AF21_SPAPN|nr:uncharacterized protein SPAPADRAFT_57912 [Spathaspora passalidarum NRRL Y-27907]EGW34825.1 hypothetical protein SPAPADRAFT_57912 [Spathaspora passalidarum NRRL Y-27907]
MPKVSNIESFIELASELYSTYPTTTTLSITYTNVSKKHSSKNTKESVTKPKHAVATHSVNFKLYEPNSGKCIKFNTFKIKELSRILNFVGPKGVNDSDNTHVVGLGSLMTNVKYDAVEEETTPAPEGTPEVVSNAAATGTGTSVAPSAAQSKKKNKKKKKKN